jgi:hypothetical protein
MALPLHFYPDFDFALLPPKHCRKSINAPSGQPSLEFHERLGMSAMGQ